ncbi:MAG: cysteine desulfurase family protein [Planctomycetota bacterium]
MSVPRMSNPIYFDNNATTPIDPRVLDVMHAAWRTAFANPGSQHSFGRTARQVLEDSREQIAGILDADPSEVIFTSGGTESLNAAIHGFTFGRQGLVALTAGEHPATREACQTATTRGLRLTSLPVTPTGLLDPASLNLLPWPDLRLCTVILAHNETGVIQDVSTLAELCRSHRVPLLLDAVQAVGKLDFSFRKSGAAAVAFGAHKFHGPRGIGGLLLRRGLRIPGLLVGGHQESGRRAGTEPVPLAAGMAAALQFWHAERQARTQRMSAVRDRLAAGLAELCSPVVIHGMSAPRLPNTLNIAFPGISGEALLVNLHLAEVACSLGSTCASGSVEPAPVLLAMGVPEDLCLSSVRFSVSYLNTEQEVDRALPRIAAAVSRLRSEKVRR